MLVEKGIVHRDLKPANILVNRKKNEFKLADFGLAKMVENYDEQMLHSICGTPIYMAPQILACYIKFEKFKSYTTKCDIWSLGCIFY